MIIYIHGPDTFRSREKLKEIIAEFKKKRDPYGVNIARLSGQDLTFERFRHEALSSGFLSPRRMVVIEEVVAKGGKDTVEKIAEFLLSQTHIHEATSNVLVFWEAGGSEVALTQKTRKERAAGKRREERALGLGAFLQAQPYTFYFPLLLKGEVEQWIIKRVQRAGGSIEPAAARQLAAIVESDLWRAHHEIEKLTAWRQGSVIAPEDIAALVEPIDTPASGFAFLDAMAERSAPQALNRLYELIRTGTEPIAVQAMLVRLFRTICLIKSYLEDETVKRKDKAAEDVGLHPYTVKKTLPQTARFSWDELYIIAQRLLQLDAELKGGSEDPMVALEMFVIEVCNSSNSRSEITNQLGHSGTNYLSRPHYSSKSAGSYLPLA